MLSLRKKHYLDTVIPSFGSRVMKCSVIIQARRGSSRFFSKVTRSIVGKPMLYHVIRRTKHADLVSEVILATSKKQEDKILEDIATATGIRTFFGNSDDVLDRYYQAAKEYGIRNVVRITADCPLIDPGIIDRTIEKFREGSFDYVSNSIRPTFPEGLSVEVFSFEALERAWLEARLMSEREHVTPYIWKNSNRFKLGELSNTLNLSHLRWTVDYKADLAFVKVVYHNLFKINPYFSYSDILQLLERKPHLKSINAGIKLREGYEKSLREDREFHPPEKLAK